MVIAGSGTKNPTHDITLSDGTTTVGLKLANPSTGRHDPLALQRGNYPRMATQFSQGGGEYSDIELPFKSVVQQDWSQGGGQKMFNDNTSKYYRNVRTITYLTNELRLAPMERFVKVDGDNNFRYYGITPSSSYGEDITSGDWAWTTLQPGEKFAYKFTIDTTLRIHKAIVPIRGVNGDLKKATVKLKFYNDAGGLPGSEIVATSWQRYENLEGNKLPPYMVYQIGDFDSGVTLTLNSATPDYWLVIESDSSNTGDIEVLSHKTSGAFSDGSSWAAHSYSPSCYITASVDLGSINGNFIKNNGRFFTWNHLTYYVTFGSDPSTIYVNGERREILSATTSTITINESPWTASELQGYTAIVLSEYTDDIFYSVISDNTTDTITLEDNMTYSPVAGDKLIIVYNDKMNRRWNIRGNVKDVAPARYGYIIAYHDVLTDTEKLEFFRENTESDIEVTTIINTDNDSYDRILVISTDDGDKLFVASNNDSRHGVSIFDFDLPNPMPYSAIFTKATKKISLLTQYGTVWNDHGDYSYFDYSSYGVNRYTGSGAGTAMMFSHRFEQPIDMSDVSNFRLKLMATDTLTDFGIKVGTSDKVGEENRFKPSYVAMVRNKVAPIYTYIYDGGDTTYYPLTETLTQHDANYRAYLPLETNDYFYMAFDEIVDDIFIDVITANTNTATMDFQIWEGKSFATLTGTVDGTASGGVTLSQSGHITFLPDTWQKGIPEEMQTAGLDPSLYWCRFSVSANLSSTTAISNIRAKPVFYDTKHESLPWVHDNTNDKGEYTDFYEGDDKLLIMCAEPFDTINFEFDTYNTTASSLSLQYWNGYKFEDAAYTDTTASGGVPFAQDGYIKINDNYVARVNMRETLINGQAGYAVLISVPDCDSIVINKIYCSDSASILYLQLGDDIDGNNVGRWIDINFPFDTNYRDFYSSVNWIAIYGSIASGYVYFDGELWSATDNPKAKKIGNGADVVRRLIGYGIDRENPWIITDRAVYEYDTEEDTIKPISIKELDALSSPSNANAATVNDVHLWFNIRNIVSRYYNGELDSTVSPTRGEGMHISRRGNPSELISAPGKVFLATSRDLSNVYNNDIEIGTDVSTIMVYDHGGWHELYNAPRRMPIRSAHIESVPTEDYLRLWVALDTIMLYIPLPYNDPDNLDSLYYFPDGVLVTSWFNDNFATVEKLWLKLKMFTKNLESDTCVVDVYYQTDEDNPDTKDAVWHRVTEEVNVSPIQEVSLSADDNVASRMIRFMLILRTKDFKKTPVIEAYTLDSIFRLETKHTYNITFFLGDRQADLSGKPSSSKAIDLLSVLDSWSSAPAVVLTMRSNIAICDNKRVILEPSTIRPYTIRVGEEEHHLCEAMLIEV